jgi:hypothetical protein
LFLKTLKPKRMRGSFFYSDLYALKERFTLVTKFAVDRKTFKTKASGRLLFFCGLLCAVLPFASCDKVAYKPVGTAALVVTNAVVGGAPVKLNSNVRDSAKKYGAMIFGITDGSTNVTLFSTSNVAKPYYSNTVNAENGGIYSAFLTGSNDAPESVWIKENIPGFYTDSVVGVRLINLSPNSSPVNLVLASDNTTSIFSGVAYKQITGFLKLPLKKVVPAGSVSFQIRDAATNDLLTTYTLPTAVNSAYPSVSIALARFRNITLVLKGMKAGVAPDGLGLFPVAYYY